VPDHSALGYLAGNVDAIRADLIRRLPEKAHERFPASGGVLVKLVPEGKVPAFIAVYDRDKLVEILAAEFGDDDRGDGEDREDGERYDDAEEWVAYNMADAFPGPNAPVIAVMEDNL
jgi:hypothetical protein